MTASEFNPRLVEEFADNLDNLAAAPSFARYRHQSQLLTRAQKLLRHPNGVAALYAQAPRFDAAGVFSGGDWLYPAQLEPALAGPTLRAGGAEATMEALSELRLLAIANGAADAGAMTPASARAFLREVLAQNLDLVFPAGGEAERAADHGALTRAGQLLDFVLRHLGSAEVLEALTGEVARIMAQRPILTTRVEALLGAAERALAELPAPTSTATRARQWIDAARAPSPCVQAHGQDYAELLPTLSADALAAEAACFGRAMAATGLVASHHAELLRHVLHAAPERVPDALALGPLGRATWQAFEAELRELAALAITPASARAVLGLARLVDTGLACVPALLPGLQRLARLPLHPETVAALAAAGETATPNSALLAGAINVLGLPCGMDQGFNPTCQAARAISLWAHNDPVRLLALLAEAARDDDLVLDFEGEPLRASEAGAGMAKTLHTELDPVSLVLTPHLDRLYVEMGRRTVGRPGDGHRWVNRAMHGPWVAPDFAELIDLDPTQGATITGLDEFMALFHASYHPAYNGGRPLVYAQPCGIAATDATGEYIGWHAVAIQRVARAGDGRWRVYFFNPNRDKDQNWGQGVETAIAGNGEHPGESSLPFAQFASRLYLFHYDAAELGATAAVPGAELAAIRDAVANSWGRRFAWAD